MKVDHRLIVILYILLTLSGCGDGGGDATLECGNLAIGQSCSASTSDGAIFWKLTNLRPQEEYAVVVMSDKIPESNADLRMNFTMRSDAPSAMLDSNEAELIKSVQAQQGSGSDSGESDEPIRPPRNNFKIVPENIGDPLDIYIPFPGDYHLRLDNKVLPLYVSSPSGKRLTGKKVGFATYATTPNSFSLLNDPSFSEDPSNGMNFQTYIQKLNTCLQTSLPTALSVLGAPYDLDGKPEINVLVTKFQGSLGNRTLGLFSSMDRFKTSDGKALEDSNYGEYLYLAPATDPSRSCSTGVHELQHLVSFDRKVLSQIPESKRSDLDQKDKRNLLPEELGLDEAYAHVFEELSGENQRVSEHIYNFIVRASLSSFSLETAFSDVLGNSRSRGLNTLFLYYAIKRAGGRLSYDDSVTREFLNRMISSPNIGFDNIAKYFGIKEGELLEGFFQGLMMSLFSSSSASNFLPALESSTSINGQPVSRGFQIKDRASAIDNISYAPPTAHPYQFELKNLGKTDNFTMPAQGLLFYRYITPSTVDAEAEVEFMMGGQEFSVYLVRVR